MKIATRIMAGLMLAGIAAAAPAQFGTPTADTLVQAIKFDEFDKIQTMIKDQPQLASARTGAGQTALMAAIEKRSVPILSFLLFHKADPNGTDSGGDLPLVASARKGWAEGVDGLLEMGAKVDGRNRQGETALIVAVQSKNIRVVRQLLDKGADPDIADRLAGYSARDYAKRENRTPELLRLIESAKKK